MTVITLPKAIQDFVAATNAHDADALARTFAPGATVQDVGTTFATPAELQEFIKEHIVAPKVVLTPISYEDHVLVASGDGEFPGGPISFSFAFAITDDAITNLVIEQI